MRNPDNCSRVYCQCYSGIVVAENHLETHYFTINEDFYE